MDHCVDEPGREKRTYYGIDVGRPPRVTISSRSYNRKRSVNTVCCDRIGNLARAIAGDPKSDSKETPMGLCSVKALIPTPVPRVWDFIIDPRNMPLWVPNIKSVAGVDRPLQVGDRLTQWRRDFFRLQRQDLLVEEVIPYRSFRLRILSAKGRPLDATATVTLEQAADPGSTWMEEAIAFSLGKGALVRWVERWLLDPLSRVLVQRKSTRALRCLAERLTQGAGAEQGAQPGAAPDRGGR
jgi:uncharacterized protein YndB with AHSA1/START domain